MAQLLSHAVPCGIMQDIFNLLPNMNVDHLSDSLASELKMEGVGPRGSAWNLERRCMPWCGTEGRGVAGVFLCAGRPAVNLGASLHI